MNNLYKKSMFSIVLFDDKGYQVGDRIDHKKLKDMHKCAEKLKEEHESDGYDMEFYWIDQYGNKKNIDPWYPSAINTIL